MATTRRLLLCSLLALFLIAIAACSAPARPASLAGTRWELVDFTGTAAAPIPTQVTGLLELREDTFVLDVGCNDLSAFYTVEGNTLTIQPGFRSMVNCADAIGTDGMELEHALFEALPTFQSVSVTDDGLLRLDYRNGELLFRPASETVTTGPALNPAPEKTVASAETGASSPGNESLMPDATAVAVAVEMEADAETLAAYMRAAPERRSQFGGVYLAHSSSDVRDIADSLTVLQFVGSEEEAVALRNEVLSLALDQPDRVQIERVTCAYDHLQAQEEKLLASTLIEDGIRSLAVDVRGNRVTLGITPPAGAQVTADNTIDKATLPADLAALVADPCIVVVASEP